MTSLDVLIPLPTEINKLLLEFTGGDFITCRYCDHQTLAIENDINLLKCKLCSRQFCSHAFDASTKLSICSKCYTSAGKACGKRDEHGDKLVRCTCCNVVSCVKCHANKGRIIKDEFCFGEYLCSRCDDFLSRTASGSTDVKDAEDLQPLDSSHPELFQNENASLYCSNRLVTQWYLSPEEVYELPDYESIVVEEESGIDWSEPEYSYLRDHRVRLLPDSDEKKYFLLKKYMNSLIMNQ